MNFNGITTIHTRNNVEMVGSTGDSPVNHLHIDISYNNSYRDPEAFLIKERGNVK